MFNYHTMVDRDVFVGDVEGGDMEGDDDFQLVVSGLKGIEIDNDRVNRWFHKQLLSSSLIACLLLLVSVSIFLSTPLVVLLQTSFSWKSNESTHNIVRQLRNNTSSHIPIADNPYSEPRNHSFVNYDKCPNLLPTLDRLVLEPRSRVRVYLTYHNEIGRHVAQNITCHHTRQWIVPVLCNATKYFEYYAYKVFTEMTIDDFQDVDYVLIAGYKTFAPTEWALINGVPFSTQDAYIQSIIQYANKHSDYDIIPFDLDSQPIFKTFPKFHGTTSLNALSGTLRAVNWTEEEIENSLWTHAFYRNSFLAKPEAFLKIAKWMTTLIDVVETNPRVSSSYDYDAGYPYSVKETAMKIFGVPYYLLHPFVMERLVSLVVHHLQLSVSDKSFKIMMREVDGPLPPIPIKITKTTPAVQTPVINATGATPHTAKPMPSPHRP